MIIKLIQIKACFDKMTGKDKKLKMIIRKNYYFDWLRPRLLVRKLVMRR